MLVRRLILRLLLHLISEYSVAHWRRCVCVYLQTMFSCISCLDFGFLHFPFPRMHTRTYIVRPNANMIPSPYTVCTYKTTRRQIECDRKGEKENSERQRCCERWNGWCKSKLCTYIHTHTVRTRKERGDGKCKYILSLYKPFHRTVTHWMVKWEKSASVT